MQVFKKNEDLKKIIEKKDNQLSLNLSETNFSIEY